MSHEGPKQEASKERVKPVAAKYVGERGFALYFSDGTQSWVDREGRELWETQNNIPSEERLANLPPPPAE